MRSQRLQHALVRVMARRPQRGAQPWPFDNAARQPLPHPLRSRADDGTLPKELDDDGAALAAGAVAYVVSTFLPRTYEARSIVLAAQTNPEFRQYGIGIDTAVPRANAHPKVIVSTSAGPGEGKTPAIPPG